MSGRRRPGPPPLPDDLALVLIDGDNLLHRARGTRDDGAVRWLLPRLRAWRPPDVRVVLMLDGHPEPGEAFRRQVVTGIESQYSGAVDADTALIKRLGAHPYEERIRTVLVTDDRALADRARHLHAQVRRLDWFLAQLAGAGSGASGRPDRAAGQPSPGTRATGAGPTGTAPARPVGVGAGRPPAKDASRAPEGERERPPWKPGRGATRKSGNPKRGHPPG
jgi:hypothetical protein